MNSINVNPLNTMTLQAMPAAPAEVQEQTPQIAGDSVELGSASRAQAEGETPKAEARPGKKMSLRELPGRIKKSGKPDKELVTYAVHHPKVAAVAVGVAAAVTGVAGAVLISNAGNGMTEVVDLVKSASSMSTVKEKAAVFCQAGKLLGAGAAAGAIVGAGGMTGKAIFDSVSGATRVASGIKKGDHLKAARGARKLNVGLKGALAAGTAASYGLTEKAGGVGAFRTAVMPTLKVATAVLNTTVGSLQLIKGVKDKNKKDIIGGTLNLAVGVAAGASLAIGGGIVATACTVFSAARSTFNGINTAVKFHKYVKDAKAEMNGTPAPDKADSKASKGTQETKDAQKPQEAKETGDSKAPEKANTATEVQKQVEADPAYADLEKLLNTSIEDSAIWVDG